MTNYLNPVLLIIPERVDMRFFLALLLSISASSHAQTSSAPKGDMAIFALYQSSIVCAALARVNPEAIDMTGSDHYFDDAVNLYAYFHDIPLEEARSHQEGWIELLSSDTSVKSKSLNSSAGARKYLNQYLHKTDASSCSRVRPAANQVLSAYGVQL